MSNKKLILTGIFAGSISDEERIRYAMEAQNYSYSPYSHFKVGAALLTVNGTVYTGKNVENAAYGPTIGAEQVAVCKAVSEGDQKFSAIAVTSSGGDFAYPGGPQRQVLAEFGLDTRFIAINGTDIKKQRSGISSPILSGRKICNPEPPSNQSVFSINVCARIISAASFTGKNRR